jgi:hypothetical protein
VAYFCEYGNEPPGNIWPTEEALGSCMELVHKNKELLPIYIVIAAQHLMIH